MTRPSTIVCDIDGTIFKHHGDISKQHLTPAEILPGVIEAFRKWDLECARIILLSGRRESTRACTEKQLSDNGIFYDVLILGATGGKRIIINDMKEGRDEPTCAAINLVRNKGMA